ncbi:MAG TPA: SDR family NAD(P)-dependent oxidoreductase [Vicinamibacterales bacterium]|nr:SDR family NAD(P)-dependent oxidoreductase [Vicinamibacterales bacterium]
MPVVFVTGAGRGVGRAIARRFGNLGYAVAAAGRSEALLRQLAEELTDRGSQTQVLVCDVTDRGSIRRSVAEAERQLGPIDVLINNAGVAESAPFPAMSDELWDRILAVNLTGTYLCTRAVIPGMFERRRGRVINIASVAGRKGFAYSAAYCAAKHGVVGLTRALAIEAAPKGVTVNAICPGWLDTDMTRESIERIVRATGRSAADARASLERMNPQRRLIDPDEVAALAVYLAGPDARGITGQTLGVDGGELTA